MSNFGRLFAKAQDLSHSEKRPKSIAKKDKGIAEPTGSNVGEKKKWIDNPKIGDFKLGAILGTGSFGRVHLAHHNITGQVCAIKSLSKASILKTRQASVTEEMSLLSELKQLDRTAV